MEAHILHILFILFGIKYTSGNINEATEFARNPEQYTSFYLYSSIRFEDAEILPINDPDVLMSSKFNPELPTRMLIHDFNGNKNDDFNRYVVAAYLLHQDLNIIVVDWSSAVNIEMKNYQVAVHNTVLVGNVIGSFLEFLNSALEYPLNQVYLIGFGLGAHAAGFAGKKVKSGVIGTIFALDPTGYPFNVNNTATRLSSDDAEYVEVIHTNFLNFGTYSAIGTADFYANGGGVQLGCPGRATMCSHQRSFKIFAESVNNANGFKGKICEGVLEATSGAQCRGNAEQYFVGGEPARINQQGIFSFRTGLTDPYSRILV